MGENDELYHCDARDRPWSAGVVIAGLEAPAAASRSCSLPIEPAGFLLEAFAGIGQQAPQPVESLF